MSLISGVEQREDWAGIEDERQLCAGTPANGCVLVFRRRLSRATGRSRDPEARSALVPKLVGCPLDDLPKDVCERDVATTRLVFE